ncbi:hypothetical protein K435DRAFT_960923 [Dendrothele bispora CBS 962.96]|uniref:Cupredoxin n=1 Tax=Dendrothele bispora (strain CBS 962.96) TaxID=1314807 RepID=A0A4S8MSE9_DENBC|nr:hypothetical protein K435DRAFT_960923 [Dendrothele bispora CBS 962.96]
MMHLNRLRFASTAIVLSYLSSTALATNFDVAVGPNGNLVFYPEYVIAQQGDTVNFVFHPKNHTVTQSSFDSPCVPIDGGLNSGFMPVPEGSEGGGLPNWSVTVNDTNPVWLYCQQTNPFSHCGKGMVFAINPPDAYSDHSFAAFQAKAVAINGTGTTSDSVSVPVLSTPPAMSWTSATATVTSGTSSWVTTYTSYDGTPQPTYDPSGPMTHKIIVGDNKQLMYNPMNISASLGDTVVFEFRPKNHTVTQSTFGTPCQPKEGGFASGFMPVSENATDSFPTFQITINDTAPIWGYCQQTNPASHCGAGMVFAINAVESGPNNFAAFQALAQAQDGPTSNSTPTPSGSGSGSGNGGNGTNNGGDSGNGNTGLRNFGTGVSGLGLGGGVLGLGLMLVGLF